MQHHVVVSVGGCGNAIGNTLWRTMSDEHGLSEDGTQGDPSSPSFVAFAREVGDRRFAPRAIIVDTEPGTLDVIRASPIGSMFRPENFVLGNEDAGGNFARGMYGSGPALLEPFEDVLRHELQASEGPVNVILILSAGGGTGSGVGVLFARRIRELYPDGCITCFVVLSSPDETKVAAAPYNHVLCLAGLHAHADLVVLLDNEALATVAPLGTQEFDYAALNFQAARALSLLTGPLRLPCRADLSLPELADTLCPHPWAKFVGLGVDNFTPPGTEPCASDDPIWELSRAQRQISGYAPDDGAMLGCAWVAPWKHSIRGEVVHARFTFPSWAPPHVLIAATKRSDPGTLLVANHTGLGTVLRRELAYFDRLYDRQRYVEQFVGAGLDPAELGRARETILDLTQRYADAYGAGQP
jgi:tubulin beta